MTGWSLRCCVGSCAAAGLLGAEVPVADLAVVAEARPTAFGFAWSRDGRTWHGRDAFDRALGLGVAATRGFSEPGAPAQWLAGGGLLWIDERFGTGGRSGPLLRAEAGWGYGLGDRLLVSATARFAAGWSRFDLPGGTFGGGSLSGTMLEGGPCAGVRWAVGERIAVGAQAGWLFGRDRYSGDGATLELDRSDVWAGLSCAWVLDPFTRRIE